MAGTATATETKTQGGVMALDVRGDFPILKRQFDGNPLVYLDSASTAQKPQVVIDALAEHLRQHNANVHRGVYALAQEADAAYEQARARVAAFTGAEAKTTIFTKNVTEAINLVAYAWGRANVDAGDAVLITQMEHHANLVPWQGCAKSATRSCATWGSMSTACSTLGAGSGSSNAATSSS